MGIKRLIISCGGTGGHFNPGLSVARELKDQGGEAILLLGGAHSKIQAETAAKFGILSLKIKSAPIPKGPFSAIKFAFSTFSGTKDSLALIKSFKPEAMLAMGSFASFPPALASWLSGTPLFLHDGNARLGRANKLLSRFAKAIALSFPASDAAECRCPTILTGMPLRQEITGPQIGKAEAIAFVNSAFNSNFSPTSPVLLAFGGSLGAEAINNGVPAALKTLDNPPQVIHLSGPGRAETVRKLYEGFKGQSLIMDSCYDMARLFPAADLTVCRSGGSTVSELAVFGKYALLVPYPHASDSHQDDNAAWLASAGGAKIIKDRDFKPAALAEALRNWLVEPERLTRLGENSRRLGTPDASAKVLEMISNIAPLRSLKS